MIDRRTLLRGGMIAGAATVCGEHVGDAAPAVRPAPPPTHAPPGAPPGFELEELTIAELQSRLASHADTSASLVDRYRRRILAMNEKGPALRAVLELDPDADAIAKQLDAERAAGKLRGPLHGIPILVKDNIDTGDKMSTTAGSLVLEGSRAPMDAFVVAKLRAAGAIILGKANLSEWANFRGAASSSGWSARGGQCRNPYVLDRSPSGSSSGSAVAVAASLCAAALGSETDGSIVSPASCNGVVGIKPTIGLVSRTGVIPIAPSQDTVGPLARTVRDAALLLAVIAGADPQDAVTAKAKPVDYASALDAKTIAGARLGVPRKGYFGVNRNVDAVMTAALAKLKELGAVLVDPVELELPPDAHAAELAVLKIEIAVALNEYLRTRPDARVHSLADIVEANKRLADRELHGFGQEYFEQALQTKGLEDRSYLDARAKCVEVARQIDKAMTDHKLDAFVAGTNGPAWLIDPINGDGRVFSASSPAAIAGYPHVTVPGGEAFGLPIGLSFFGRPFSEAKLLGFAYAFEQATKHRKPPRYRATASVA